MPRSPMSFASLDAVLFDVIGTLVDDDSAIATAADQLALASGLSAGAGLLERWTGTLDDRMRSVIDGAAPWQPHRQLLVHSAREAITGLGGQWSEKSEQVVDLDRTYRAWPDVAEATRGLRRLCLVTALSNGDLDALALLAHRNDISWDIALSAGTVETFKPSPRAYEYAIDALRLEPARTLFVASHPWDLRAAAVHGFRTAFIGRPGAQQPEVDDRFDLHLPDVASLVPLFAEGGEPRS